MRREDVSPEKIELMNQGLVESQNLMETLSVSLDVLLNNVYPNLDVNLDDVQGIVKKFQKFGEAIHEAEGLNSIDFIVNHTSDIVRGWGCYVIRASALNLEESLTKIRPFANDSNSGVREWAWMAIRPRVISDFEKALTILEKWTEDDSENIRRFASEITRPRGVWCSHIQELKNEPWLGQRIIDPLKQDSSKYVQKSVANWLNDAGKSQPDWVKQLCKQWSQSGHPSTLWICKRAQRNFK
jgi:3-methyladenine DNA glycosylase AlkC